MSTLGNPGGTLSVMKKYDIRPQKKFGQNFLIDRNILEGIVRAAGITKDDMVLEIGPGLGSMTRLLSESAGKVAAVEIDKKLIPVLNDTLKDCPNVMVINEDILKMDIRALILRENNGKPVKVVANLPYYITTPIIMGLLEEKAPVQSMTIMIQKEVAERMTALPGKKTYGALSLAVSFYTEAKKVMEVPPSCFIPAPKVSSTVMHLKVREEPEVKVHDEALLFSLIRASFNQRRKTLYNGLKNDPKLAFTPHELASAIEKLGKSPTVRGEELSLAEFASLADILGV